MTKIWGGELLFMQIKKFEQMQRNMMVRYYYMVDHNFGPPPLTTALRIEPPASNN